MAHAFELTDIALLEKSMSLRERMVDNIARRNNDELPTKPSDILAITGLVDSIDRSIFTKAKINIDDSSTKNADAERAILRQLMVDLHTNKQTPVVTGLPLPETQAPVFVPQSELTVHEGELIPKSDNFYQEL